ncbi:MAG: MBL fold metallo-hydrolase, partial [Acidobacteriota bacterium]
TGGDEMPLTCRQINPGACKTYVIAADSSPEVILVDPVLEHADRYRESLEAEKRRLVAVIDTHCHADHLSAGAALADATGCEYLMHRLAAPSEASKSLEDGGRVPCGDSALEVLHTPGHTEDSVSLVVGDCVLTGDALFLDGGGAGRDDLPGGDPGKHWDSLQKLLGLPGHLVVHPGHEYRQRQPSTLGAQRTSNPHLAPRSREEFVRYLDDLQLGPAEWMIEVLKANAACARDLSAAWIPQGVPACEVRGTLAGGAKDLPVATVSAHGLHAELHGEKRPVLLDVREAMELDGPLGRLDGIVHVPIRSLGEQLAALDAHRAASVVTVCKTGGRARTAAQILMQAGFKDVRLLVGGMEGWHHAGLTPTSPAAGAADR